MLPAKIKWKLGIVWDIRNIDMFSDFQDLKLRLVRPGEYIYPLKG